MIKNEKGTLSSALLQSSFLSEQDQNQNQYRTHEQYATIELSKNSRA